MLLMAATIGADGPEILSILLGAGGLIAGATIAHGCLTVLKSG